MVFRRGVALLCIAAAVALADVGGVVEAKDVAAHKHHHKEHQHVEVKAAAEETKIDYPNGSVLISTKDDKTKKDDGKAKEVKKVEEKKAKEAKKVEEKKATETVASNGEITRKYAHGSVRIFKKDTSTASVAKHKKDAEDKHLHKAEVVTDVHASTHHHKHKHADKGEKGEKGNHEVTKDFELKEGENKFDIEGVPVKITVDHGKVDVDVNGQHVKSGADITVEVPAHKDEKKDVKETKKKKDVEHKKKADDHHKKKAGAEKKKEAAKKDEKKKAATTTAKTDDKQQVADKAKEADAVKAADAKADRVTELATKLSKNDRGFFSTETAPIVFICGIIGALAAVVGIAAVAVARGRDHSVDGDSNLQSVLADSNDLDIEAGVQADAPADEADSLEDSDSDNDDEDDEDAGEGTFANNDHPTVSV